MCIKNSESSLLKSLKYFSLSLLIIFTLTLSVSSNKSYAQAAGGLPTDDATLAKGKELFSNNCTSCHQISDQVVVGPGLKDVDKRRPLPWIIAFVKNSEKVIASGDKYANDLYNKFNKTRMPPHDFSDADITSIVAYISKESSAPAAAAATPGAAAGEQGGAAKEEGAGSLVTVLLLAFIVILLLILIVLVIIVTVLSKYLKQKSDLAEEDKELVEQGFDFKALIKNRAFLGILTFVFVAIVAKATLDGAYNLGVQQGYAPTQEIPFSHKLHAGQYKIDCNYCHTGVRKSMSANIPSANICMNCHNTIKPESPHIQKIYAAIEKDEPIQWVRVHNLPDLAYFNHSQHVKVAGLECQTCHGPIQEMEVVQQYAPLTMGWCINCHRQTEVNGKDNGYYDALLKEHNAASGGKTPMTVEHIGGLECSKCHY
jgi:mono/diheme cytochrome c family protein